MDCLWVKRVGGLLFLTEKSSHHTHAVWVTHTPPPLPPLTIRADTKQLLPDGLTGERGIGVCQGVLARKLQL